MHMIVEHSFNQWTQGQSAVEARIHIYEAIREIPYAVIPELNDFETYPDILRIGKGSCTPKHLLLGDMCQRLGNTVLYAVYPFRWDEAGIDFPPGLRRLARNLPTSHHLACRIEIDGRLVLVDATLDSGLRRLGLPVNEDWDGRSDTLLPMGTCGDEQVYHPSEASSLRARTDQASLAFYSDLNRWLDEVRGH
jgi:hypothetical protein